MSDTSGPFAVPNFAQADDDEEFDTDEAFEDEVDNDQAAPVTSAEEAPSAPVDGGAAKAVLEHIARSIVDEPDAVVVDASAQRGGLRLDLHVAGSDMGRIIGRRGRVAQALRSVVRAAAAKDGTDATVDIVD